jgi:hypothetical protein
VAFQKFTAVGSRFAPRISIRSNGSLGINQGAMKRFFSDRDYKAVVLYYDADTQTIGIEPLENENEDGAIRLNKRPLDDKDESQGTFVSAKSFFDFYNIPYLETKSFPVQREVIDGKRFITLKLSEAEA